MPNQPAPMLRLRIFTENSWFIGNVAVLGRISDPPNRGQLVNATRLNLGQPFIETALAPGADRYEAAAREQRPVCRPGSGRW